MTGEEIEMDELSMKEKILKKRQEHLRSRREFSTEKNVDFHKSNLIGMVFCIIYYILFIVIGVLQLKIFSGYDVHALK